MSIITDTYFVSMAHDVMHGDKGLVNNNPVGVL